MSVTALVIRLIPIVAATAASSVATAGCVLDSPSYRTALVELYTSEGCNSCPPADRWLSSLRASVTASRSVVALAFHVDYWDRLGWRDRFSQAPFGERQRELAARQHSRAIYTPQVILDGRELRRWSDPSLFAERVAAVNREPAAATISATAALEGTAVHVRGLVKLQPLASGSQAWIALFENGLATPVTAGENAGRRLQHDFVVRTLLGPLPAGQDGSLRLDRVLPTASDWDRSQLGVAVFTQDPRTGHVAQAVARTACL